MFGNDDKRFEIEYKQESFGRILQIIKDKETGICYLFSSISGYGGGLTPLLDSNGNPKKCD